MSDNKFLKELMGTIIGNKDMPKVQVEREIAPILDIFIKSVFNKLAEKGKIDEGNYILIGAEFPFDNEENSKNKRENSKNKRSKNIDYLLLNEDKNILYFVELKTDSNSFCIKQYNRYKKVIKRIENKSAEFLYTFLGRLTNPKYKEYKEKIVKKLPEYKWSQIKQAKLVYLAPKRIKDRKWGKENKDAIKEIEGNNILLNFKDMPIIELNTFSNEWNIIRRYLKELDGN
ncbi:MAG: hypothetical protein DRQ51_04915 [Gammaproteobacteria bacterium]|nr:MAG: hypothetical protein DRQ51_04915 [Gammaproteobacteria bacterium]